VSRDGQPRRVARAVAAAIVLAVLVGFALKWTSARTRSGPTSSQLPLPTNNRPSAAVAAPAREVDHSTLADDLNSPRSDIGADLRVIALVLDTFRSNFPHDGNPVGTNAEITAALTGRNRLRLSLIPSDHAAINANGELCDRWGTPFFFHAESGTQMEIRSAGPDRKMWNQDDVVLAP
jgi:hypothetical protein